MKCFFTDSKMCGGTRHRFDPMAQLQNRVSGGLTNGCFARFAGKAAAFKHAPCGPVFLPVDRRPEAARNKR
jgi:hypothetical protein